MPHTNALINATSPYLLQHAHNPVNWQAWSEELVEKARAEDKLILVSIGYAACHWCHVMEHESFEDEKVAAVMNENFVCIKVDREERPDVDHYYMSAVQLMGQQGGWPLNVIALPDGRPIWGGTYFPKDTWVENLKTVAAFCKGKRSQAEEYASRLQEGIQQVSLMPEVESEVSVSKELLQRGVDGWKKQFDYDEGGRAGAPKFPMPVNLDFQLYYGFMNSDQAVLDYVETTLLKMARGGIYDQVGGGFARYSVDEKWKVPHFEKMLYDNGQLISIYSKAWQYFQNEEFKTVVYETIAFIERELMDENGAFYSSLDADSEGEEGKFYVWKKAEIQEFLGDEYSLFEEYYNVNSKGFWEHNNYILLRDISNEEFAEKHDLSLHQLQVKVGKWKYALLKARSKRVRPGLDDKTLTSWNALVLKGLADAYKAFRNEEFLSLAIKNADFIENNLMKDDGQLFHSWKKGITSIDGFLEDYALLIEAFLAVYEVSGDEKWLALSDKLVEYTFAHFFDKQKQLFYFNRFNAAAVITNHFQKEDNVIPSANSVMANNLHRLYLIHGKPELLETARKMLQYITPHFCNYPMAYANWGTLLLKLTAPYFEVAVCGINSRLLLKKLQRGFQPHVLWAVAEKNSEVPLLKDRFFHTTDLIYVCKNGSCELPVEEVEEAAEKIRI
ncbi:thioredoxin domain-containing protein [Draconibacterium sp. IB214405]|uniref:thioredoxin domain-containing protein n=1 Tax=Draconibacterium sp. IB214405 TaxID=3097352 RepID=UPI002A0C718A|nr:thioredoxin domain-containing protein [Draconibacterium sp. IB214405]MDX8340046.1 thioredoxin domain-containing protein [Draconibacterium sp. IB214405]